jgi:hypothetical protein
VTVGLSFAFVLARDLRASAPVDGTGRTIVPAPVRILLRLIGLVAWLWIVAQGIVGGSSDADVASLFLWVYGWVGVALVSALVFPVWHWLDPFSTLHDIGAAGLRAVGFRGWSPASYPARIGRWPAAAGFAFFVWLELVQHGGAGGVLFVVVMGYTAYTLAMMTQFGRDTWRANGEVFGVWFRLLNRLAPFALADEAGRLRRRPLAGGLLERGWSAPDIVLVALGTGAILFDGLSQTTAWYELLGFPAVPLKTVQLVGFLGLIVVAALFVARSVGLRATGAGLPPISVGYLLAHYLTYLLIDGQRILIAISDPLQLGWDIFGTAFHEPTGAWLSPGLVWTVQLGAVVGGHMLGAWGGHVAAERKDGRDLRLRQVPLAVVMIVLTTVTLWSLGQEIIRTPDEATGSAGPAPVMVEAA